MLGSKRPVFRPTAYDYSRRKRRIPRWLVLMLTGVIIGAGGLLFIQTSYGPTRLTVEQSEQLHFDLNSANAENQRLQSQLGQTTRELEEIQTRLKSQQGSLDNHDQIVEALKKDIDLFADAMPADPRGTSPGIRSASFSTSDGKLNYNILLMQDKEQADQTFTGEMHFNIQGRYPNGRTGYIDLDPIEVSVGRYAHLIGDVTLPDGVSPRQITIQIFEPGNKRAKAMRIINIR
ncbi:hypothetical protein E4695_11325 [Alcaligenaceae bacterium 429]|nr:hypothetical protein E4695_11325 [Alcaligenaceae bacterium 429]